MSYIAYGTRKYYEAEYARAIFIECAVKSSVKAELRDERNDNDVEVDTDNLRLYADVIEEAELRVETAKKALGDAIRKESAGAEEQTED